MRRLIALSLALFFCGFALVANALPQGVRAVIFAKRPVSGFTASCSQSTSFLARTSGLSDSNKTNYDAFICGLVTDSLFTKLEFFYLWTAPDATTAKLNLISSSFNATETATVTFTANTGIQPNGTTGFEDSNFTPSAGAIYTQNSASQGICILTSSASNSGIQMGDDSAVNNYIWVRPANTNFSAFINGGASASFTISAQAQGFWVATRTSSSNIDGYRNGSSLGAGASSTSSGRDGVHTIIGAKNSGPPALFDAYQYGAAFAGGALTSTDAANLHTRLNTYLTAYGQGSKC